MRFGRCRIASDSGPERRVKNIARPSLDKTTIAVALSLASQHDWQRWERENIPYTLRKKRQAFFKPNESQKPGNVQLE